jgi:hypothetical protein
MPPKAEAVYLTDWRSRERDPFERTIARPLLLAGFLLPLGTTILAYLGSLC